MATQDTYVFPAELKRQRQEMPWLWQILADWNIPIKSRVQWLDTGNARPIVQARIEPVDGLLWYFHVVNVFEASLERMEKASFDSYRVKPHNIQEVVLTVAVRDHLIKMDSAKERIEDIVIVERFDGKTAHLRVYRCALHGGFVTLVAAV